MSESAFDPDFGDPFDDAEDVDGENDGALELNRLDVRLPCRVYSIRYKAAVLSNVPLPVEFLLRLLYEIDDLSEPEIGDFFGFSVTERDYVINRAYDLGFVERKTGRIHLSAQGRRLFDDGFGRPRIGEVETTHAWETFDLISFQSVRHRPLGNFERGFPLLKVTDEETVSSPVDRIRKVFHRTFDEIQANRKNINDPIKHLYSVDDVQPRDRVWTLVPVSVRLTEDNEVNPDLGNWMSAAALRERSDVVRACTDLLESTIVSDDSTEKAFRLLVECAPEQVSPFQWRDGFNPEALLDRIRMQSDASGKASTLRVAGTIWTPANRKRIVETITQWKAAQPGSARPPAAIWWKPSIPHWGCSAEMKGLVEILRSQLRRAAPDAGERGSPMTSAEHREGADGFEVVLVSQNEQDLARRFSMLFDTILTHKGGLQSLPPSFEMLLVPGCCFVALVHTPLAYGTGYPVPLGVVSHNPSNVRNAHQVMIDLIGKRGFNAALGARNKDWNLVLEQLLTLHP
ncbi:hypothetical protein VY88_32945 [Azospirillum thiophilum]|uniref:Uncharacterized protein n=1 Tax=Azospirillum thiophilum TaxID=528244 RepID=A0AAC8ZWN5_9PROT|nr:hypothetical protein [Azospirillum thiophilum]ALG75727.1 hypothetical protein AL072_32825 [Azospirillum thiophilum]KJR61210.1 hypothetical protein VY88_32945 [Azospirillum thiophilum]